MTAYYGAEPGSHLQATPQHEMVVTGRGRHPHHILRLRCKCMAEYRNVSSRYYNYDWLIESADLAEINRAWKEHLGRAA